MINTYSLGNYIFSIKPNDQTLLDSFNVISIGGEGSYLNTIRIRRNNNLFTTTSYATGGWIHDKNLSRVGTVEITISQLSDAIIKFIRMSEIFFEGEYEGFTLTLSKNDGTKVCTCIDCYITTIPEQGFAETSQTQTWSFTCGQINFS